MRVRVRVGAKSRASVNVMLGLGLGLGLLLPKEFQRNFPTPQVTAFLHQKEAH